MLATRKAYTGGNVADVFKQLVCGRIMHQLSATSAQPWSYTEFWSGPGRHALRAPNAPAATLGSHRFGASKLWDMARTRRAPDHVDYWLDWYVKVLAETNVEYREGLKEANGGSLPKEVEDADQRGELLAAPSMAQVARYFMGPADQASFVESEEDEFKVLEEAIGAERRMRALHADPVGAVPVLVPPVSRRGLVFLDPPVGKRHEETANRMIQDLAQRFPQGTFCMFYQINDAKMGNLPQYRAFRQAGFKQMWGIEMRFAEGGENATDPHTGLSNIGCGMVMANLPESPTEVIDDIETVVQALSQRVDGASDPRLVKTHDLCTMEYSTSDKAIDMWHEGLRWGQSPAMYGLEQEQPRARWFSAVNEAERGAALDKAALWLHGKGLLDHMPAAKQKFAKTVAEHEEARRAHEWLDSMPDDYTLPDNPQQWPAWMRPPARKRPEPTFKAQRERLLRKRAGGDAAAAEADTVGQKAVDAEQTDDARLSDMVKKYQWKHAQILRMKKQDLKAAVLDEVKRELKAPKPKVKGVK